MSEFINGDCMKFLNDYPDNHFDLAIVDPVYGDVTKGGYMTHNRGQRIGTGKANQKGYHPGLWKQDKTGSDYFEQLLRVSKNQIVWGGNYFCTMLPTSQGWVVWDKERVGKRYADCELAWTSFNKATRIFRFKWDGMLQGDMKNKEKRIHPTQKPVRLYEWLLAKYATKGDLILDTHVGSASSLIACEKMGFEYVGFEVDPIYYENAKARMESETAQLMIRV